MVKKVFLLCQYRMFNMVASMEIPGQNIQYGRHQNLEYLP